jgi:hypothetical protein
VIPTESPTQSPTAIPTVSPTKSPTLPTIEISSTSDVILESSVNAHISITQTVTGAFDLSQQLPNLNELGGDVRLENAGNIESFTFGALTENDEGLSIDGNIRFEENDALKSVDLSKVTSISGHLQFDGNPQLTAIDASNLVHADGGIGINGGSFEEVSIPSKS